jgi:2-keto-4-pentenoate hydratase/2-oxohepta-3-ene-1,7-dioic acid hydratase in catechol pathway
MKLFTRYKNGLICYFSFDGLNYWELINYDISNRVYKSKQLCNNFFDLKHAPPSNPTKIVALGYNYKDLIGPKESYDEPVLFLKPKSSIITNNDKIIIQDNTKVWTEVELAIIISKTAKNIEIDNARDYILGYTVANDVTTTNIHNRDHHLARSKGLDTFCPILSEIRLDIDTSSLRLQNIINGIQMQSSNTKNRILNDFEIVSFISKIMTLEPGDWILTGTPANAENSIIKDGDICEVSIDEIGLLSNPIIKKS